MKKTILFACASAIIATNAQNKINLIGLDKLEDIKTEIKSRGESPIIEALVTMKNGWTDEGFEKYGAKITEEVSDEIIIVEVPAESIEQFAELDDVVFVDFGNTYHLTMDFARPASQVSSVQEGFEMEGTTIKLDGTGVVTGLMDEGIDPNHPNFMDADGNSRVKLANNYDAGVTATTSQAIRRFTTDNAAQTHGTHVAGIMAGSYNGEGEYCYISTASGAAMLKTTGNIPYYGVATNSDLVMSGGTLADANIVKGVTAAISYAEKQGMPVVVNLSIGINAGPHDGTSSLDRSLKALSGRGIICISAGNEGDENMFVGQEFTAENTELKTFLVNNASSGIDIWGDDSTPLTVTLAMYNPSRRTLTEVISTDAAGQSLTSDGTGDGKEAFAKYISGRASMRSEVNAANKRYHVSITGSLSQKTAGQNIALIIEGQEGHRVWVYGYGDKQTSFTKGGVSGYTDGTTDGTISDLACTDNIIAVGAYTSRTTWGTFAGVRRYTGGYKVGAISPFSSYGTTFEGVDLPVVSAPGAAIVSSLNRYYTEKLSETSIKSETTALVTGTTNAYWGSMQGTSMSCPYVSGVVALWLQADPTLTAADVKDIIKKTSVLPDGLSDEAKKQWGAGAINAEAGVKEILARKNAGIEGIVCDADSHLFVENAGDGMYLVSVPGASNIDVKLVNLQGMTVAEAKSNGSEATLDASHAGKGIYIVTATTGNARPLSLKIAIR